MADTVLNSTDFMQIEMRENISEFLNGKDHNFLYTAANKKACNGSQDYWLFFLE